MKVLAQNHPGRASTGYRAALPLAVWLSWLFEPRDLWVGVHWDRPDVCWRWALDVYVCVLPTLPLKIALRWKGLAAMWRDVQRTYWERRP